MRFKAIMITLPVLAALCGCSDGEATQSELNTASFQKLVAPYEFTLPNKVSVEITLHGDGMSQGDYAEVDEFDLDEADGQWQIWITGNVWSQAGSEAADRSRSISAMILALSKFKQSNDLDFQLNFLQIDPISRNLGLANAKATNGISLSPMGDSGCGYFWADCVDHYVVSPYTRSGKGETTSQHEWLRPVLDPVEEEVRMGDEGNKGHLVDLGFLDQSSQWWDQVPTNVFIVDPDGDVVHAFVPLTDNGHPNALAVIKAFAVVADVDTDEIVIPGDDGYYKRDMIYATMPVAKFGGDFVDVALDGVRGALAK